MTAVPKHGKNGLIYVSGAELVGANAWTVDIATDSVELPIFGDTWKKRAAGLSGFSGTLTVWQLEDSKQLATAASAGTTVALIIYPDRESQADHYSGDAIFGFGASGGVDSGVGETATFEGDDTLYVAGFS